MKELKNASICKHCNKEFEKDWRRYPKGPPLFCSRSCSNARKHSKESREKTSKSIRAYWEIHSKYAVFKNCTNCGKPKRRNGKQYCMSCASKIKYLKKPELRKDISERMKALNFGGWHTSHTIEYNGVKLDSSYEVAFAKDLDDNSVKWERPKPFLYKWPDSTEHRYYPDFFLPALNIYVDVKNDYLINRINPFTGMTDPEKIDLVSKQNNIRVVILNGQQLSFKALLAKLNQGS